MARGSKSKPLVTRLPFSRPNSEPPRTRTMSISTDKIYSGAATSTRGLVTGPFDAPDRHSWGEIHHQARSMAGALGNAGIGPGSAVALLAGDPADVAPLAQAGGMR